MNITIIIKAIIYSINIMREYMRDIERIKRIVL